MDLRGRDIRLIYRIAAILVVLAALAERTGSRSFPVRWFILSVLRQAEAVACAFVADTTRTDWPSLEEQLEIESRPYDSALLAWRFRAFAAVLSAALQLACLEACLPIAGAPGRGLHRSPAGSLSWPGGALRPHDTS